MDKDTCYSDHRLPDILDFVESDLLKTSLSTLTKFMDSRVEMIKKSYNILQIVFLISMGMFAATGAFCSFIMNGFNYRDLVEVINIYVYQTREDILRTIKTLEYQQSVFEKDRFSENVLVAKYLMKKQDIDFSEVDK